MYESRALNGGIRGIQIPGSLNQNLRENGLRENDLRENGLRDNGLRENGLRENSLRENGLRDNNIRIFAVEEKCLMFAVLKVQGLFRALEGLLKV